MASKPLMQCILLAVLASVLAAPEASAQEPRFDVASVRPHRAADDVLRSMWPWSR